MKKIITCSLFLFLSTFSFAQITLLKEMEVSNFPIFNTAQPSTNYFFFGVNKNSIEIYDTSMNLIKKISDLPEFYSLYGLCKNVYTSSGKYEFLINSGGNNYLYNENKEIIYDFEDFLFLAINKNRLFMSKSAPNTDNQTIRVYQLGGQFTEPDLKGEKGDKGEPGESAYQIAVRNGFSGTEQQWLESLKCTSTTQNIISGYTQSSYSVYPNPTNNIFTIEYSIDKIESLSIYNSQGALFEKYQLNPFNKSIQLNISQYAPGTYIYQFVNTTGKFIVK